MLATRKDLTYWQQELSAEHRGPTSGKLLRLAVALVLVALLLGGFDRVEPAGGTDRPPTFCAEHAGRPGWDAVCPGR